MQLKPIQEGTTTPTNPRVPLSLSKNGLAFIASNEGLELEPYNDSGNNATIGYGHLLHLGPVTETDKEKYKDFNKSAALAYLDSDAAWACHAVEELVKVHLTQAQFDALVDFTFNCGMGALAESTLLKDLNRGQYALIPGQLVLWDHVGMEVSQGLLDRRKRDGELFAHGIY